MKDFYFRTEIGLRGLYIYILSCVDRTGYLGFGFVHVSHVFKVKRACFTALSPNFERGSLGHWPIRVSVICIAGEVQMPDEDLVELKFRLYDGSDIGPFRYSPASTVAMLKDKIITEWPKDKKIAPKVANDVKLISSGKILENNKTVGQCRVPFSDLPREVITMHVVVQLSSAKAKLEKKVEEAPKKSICSCSIL